MWIAVIQRERGAYDATGYEEREMLCRAVIAEAVEGRVEITTSALSLVEVCKIDAAAEEERDLLFDFFRHPWVMMVNVDTEVGQLGRALMMAGYAGLKPADATHVASAIVAGAAELQTFDGRLLALNGVIQRPDGGMLSICRPSAPGKQMPLFDTLVKTAPPAHSSEDVGSSPGSK